MSKDNGGAAFPEVAYKTPVGGGAHMMTISGGMTLRDYFAAKAMQAMASKGGYDKWTYIAQDSYELADAMLEARK